MKKAQHKKTFNNILFLLLFLFLSFSFTRTTSAQSTNATPREAGIDEGMLNYWLRYGSIPSDTVPKTLKFLGTGFAANPSEVDQFASAIALQWIYGLKPAEGVSNYSTSIVDDLETAGYISSDQADYLTSASAGSLSFPTNFDPLPNNLKNKSDAERGELSELADLPGLILGGANRAGTDIMLSGMAIARADNLSSSVDSGSMLPEQKGTRNIGKNTGTTQGSVSGASIGPNGSNMTTNPRVLQATTTSSTSSISEKNVYAAAFSGENGNIIKPAISQGFSELARTFLPVIGAAANPYGGDIAVNEGRQPSNVAGTDPQKIVTSASVSGDGGPFGENNESLGLTDKQPGEPLTNMDDVANLAAANSANEINNQTNQLNNAQNHYSNDPNLSNLQNQFTPDEFDTMLDDRFPSDGSGGSGASTPPVTPTASNTSTCDPAKAVLSQQEVVEVADFMGLTLSVSSWTISYFQASQFLGTTIYIDGSTSTQVVDSTLIPNPNACVWVVYAPSASEGAYIKDAKSQNGEAFLFSMP